MMVGASQLPEFYKMLEKNRTKYDVRPTHTLLELKRIFQLVPKQVRLFLCEFLGELIGGCLVFELNAQVAYTFYICLDDQFEHYRPAAPMTPWRLPAGEWARRLIGSL